MWNYLELEQEHQERFLELKKWIEETYPVLSPKIVWETIWMWLVHVDWNIEKVKTSFQEMFPIE
jgi:uncharacterized protein YdhG (YjbR/CyaY superfamily)